MDISRAALEAFAKAASGGPPYPVSLDQAIHGVAATEAIIRSATSGRVEYVN
jgi:predicted dehydrogenase